MSILNNEARWGNYTSSEIVALTKSGKAKGSMGKAALTYIEEKNIERRLGMSIQSESFARPLMWGNLLEPRPFEMLGIEYILCSQESIVHPSIPFWSGSPDCIKNNNETVVDIKCPITRKSFCQLVQPIYDGLTGMDAINAIRENHSDGDKYYWQLISNACLIGAKYAELVVYMPYASEITEVKQMAEGVDDCMWIFFAKENELPFIKDGGYYKNLNIIRFEVSQSDKDFLTECVLNAGTLLINNEPNIILAHHDKEINATIIEPEPILKKLQKIKIHNSKINIH